MLYESKIKAIDEFKVELDRRRPFKKEILEKLKGYYRIGFAYSSNALEGNSLTETETKIVIEDGLTVGGKPIRDHYEAIGHSEAYDLLYELAKNRVVTEKDILDLHRLFYRRINEEDAGRYRKEKVIVTGTEFIPPPPAKIPVLMKKFVHDIAIMRRKYHPVEFSALVHKDLVTIHPFIDGNGRAARLLMNLTLLQSGYVITIIPPVLRNDYINAIKKSQIEPTDDKPFTNFISAMVYESMKDYMRLLNAL